MLTDKRPENSTNDQNLADSAAEKVKQKELKSYHENQREQNQNYVQMIWLGEVT